MNVSEGIFYLPGNFAEIVLVSKKCSAGIALRRSRKSCYSNPPQAENVASDILYSLPGKFVEIVLAYRILKGVIMRLDKYLKVSRIIKRRTVANEACDAGRVLVNDKPAKASVNVKVGDIIEILFGTKSLKIEVLDISETVKKDEAKEMYREL